MSDGKVKNSGRKKGSKNRNVSYNCYDGNCKNCKGLRGCKHSCHGEKKNV